MSNHPFNKNNPSEESCLSLANHLISQCLKTPHIYSISQINSNLITSLSESIIGSSVPDLLFCQDNVEEAHNVQAVIDMLSLDILGISLSHITGEAVISGDLFAIYNLLQVLNEIRIYLSGDKKEKENLKRKINKIKDRRKYGHEKSLSLKGSEINVSSDEELNVHKKRIQEDHIPLPENNISIFVSSNSKAAFSRTRIKLNSKDKISKKISCDSSRKESSTTPVMPEIQPLKQPNKFKENFFPSKSETKIDAPSKDATFCVADSSDNFISSEDLRNVSKSIIPNEKEENLKQSESSPAKGLIKRKLSKLPSSKLKFENKDVEKEIEQLYEENLDSKLKLFIHRNSCIKSRSSQLKKTYLQSMKKPFKRTHFSPCLKSYLLPHNLRKRSSKHKVNKLTYSRKPLASRNLSNEENCLTNPKNPVTSTGFIQTLLDEFPGIELSPSVLNHIKEKYEQHLLKMHHQVKTCLFQKPSTELQAEKAAQKQYLISNIVKKDIKEQEFLNKVKEQRRNENKIKYRLRDSRLKSVQMKQYYDEFQVEMRKKMQKRNKTEELIFEKVFKEVINIQKDHVDYLCRQAKESREEDAKKHLNYLANLENLYQSQFMLLSEKLAEETTDAKTRFKAEEQVFEKMQREFQETLKNEIRFMQKATVELMADCHFRELDAEQYIENVRKKCT